MPITDKLSAIADSIRLKTGDDLPMTLEQMPLQIELIDGGSDIARTTYTLTTTVGITNVTITHNFGFVPDVIVMSRISTLDATMSELIWALCYDSHNAGSKVYSGSAEMFVVGHVSTGIQNVTDNTFDYTRTNAYGVMRAGSVYEIIGIKL